MIAKEERKEKYISILIKELELKKDLFGNLKYIYIGGGTPSCLVPNLLTKLFTAIKNLIDLEKIVEFTLEANPNDITFELAKILKLGGVNRVSLGVQSFDPERLQLLNRKHQENDVKKAMRFLRRAGITNLNIDLIYGLENDNFSKIKKDLRKALRYRATHISTYSLIVEEKTILYHKYQKGEFKVLDEDNEAFIYQKICHYLKRRGFIHYEISNFSKKNKQSKHNLIYWNNMNYIGVGANSSYYLDNIRYTNINNLDKYFQGVESGNLVYKEVIELSKEEQMAEEMLLGLRKISGINLSSFQEKYGVDVFSVFPVIRHFISLKLLVVKNDYLLIPENKLYLSNEVLVNFI